MKILSVMMMCCVWTMAAAMDAKQAFQQEFQSIHTMEASFQQTIRTSSKVLSQSSGHMALLRPGKFRWETRKPMSQKVIADGQHVWVYDEVLEQVTVNRQQEVIQRSAGLFLSGDDDLKAFKVQSHAQGKMMIYELYALNHQTDFKQLTFEFKDHQLQRLILWDTLGQQTDVHFKHIRTNTALASSLFHFVPPKGVDVIKGGETRD